MFVHLVLQSGPFILKSPPLSAFHQQLWLTMHVHLENKDVHYTGDYHCIS